MKKIILLIVLFAININVQAQERYQIKHLTQVNSENSDFGVSYYEENQVIFASSKKNKNRKNKVWKKNNQPFLELYKGFIALDGEIVNDSLFSNNINTIYHESNAAFANDFNTIYFTRNNYTHDEFVKDSTGLNRIKMYTSVRVKDGEWTDPEEMPFNNDNYSVGHPTINKEENKLYFISDMPGSMGETDIYYVTINDDGTYGLPINAGATINTMSKEMFPFISDSGVLYFATDGRAGFGGLDIFESKSSNNGTSFSEPQNLGGLINSPKDDFSFVINEEKHNGYFSSNRDGGLGDDDIYYFEETCLQLAKGVVTDKKSGALLPRAVVTLFKDGEKVSSVIADQNGAYSFTVNCESNYKVVGSKEGYKGDEKTFLTTLLSNLGIDLPLVLEDESIVSVGNKDMIKIDPIYFDLDKSFIRPDAVMELDKVVDVMNRYPGMIVQLGSHTDSRNTDAYNQALSNRRAASTLNYITSKGIDRTRIFGQGYGKTQLVNKCSAGVVCTEEEHQLNRRTEFVIIRYE